MNLSFKNLITVILITTVISCTKEPLKSNSIQSSSSGDESLSALDIDNGNEPAGRAVRIGTQVWLTKNLNVTRYRNGDRIPQVKDPTKWSNLTTGAWCWYNNDSATYAATYGRLYNWYAVNDPRGLAPTGWHVPSDAEWTTLSTFLGGEAAAGGKMKTTGTIEAGTGLWFAPNQGATNSSRFAGLPGGNRFSNGPFLFIGAYGYWWSSTENERFSTSAWNRSLYYEVGSIRRGFSTKHHGFSVRCVRD